MGETKKSKGSKWDDSRLILWSVLCASALILAGVLLLWHASEAYDALKTPTLIVFLSGIATTLIGVGIVGVLYEAILKRALVTDIQRGSQVDISLITAGMTHASIKGRAPLPQDVLSSAKTLHIMPAKPLTWQDANFQWLVALANERSVKCRIYLPEPTRYSAILQSMPDNDPAGTSSGDCSRIFRRYEATWLKDVSGGKSTLEVFYFDGYPHSEVLLGEREAIVKVGDLSGRDSANESATYVYQGPAAQATVRWLRKMIEGLKPASISGAPIDQRPPSEILPTAKERASARFTQTDGDLDDD